MVIREYILVKITDNTKHRALVVVETTTRELVSCDTSDIIEIQEHIGGGNFEWVPYTEELLVRRALDQYNKYHLVASKRRAGNR